MDSFFQSFREETVLLQGMHEESRRQKWPSERELSRALSWLLDFALTSQEFSSAFQLWNVFLFSPSFLITLNFLTLKQDHSMQIFAYPDKICCNNFQTWTLSDVCSGKLLIAKVIQSAWESQTPVVSHSDLHLLCDDESIHLLLKTGEEAIKCPTGKGSHIVNLCFH